MRSSWITQVGPKSNDKRLRRDTEERLRLPEARPCESLSSNKSADSLLKLEEAKREPPEGAQPC